MPKKEFHFFWSTHLDADTWARFVALCKQQGHSMTWVLCQLVVQYLTAYKQD